MECRVELLNTLTARDPDRHVAEQNLNILYRFLFLFSHMITKVYALLERDGSIILRNCIRIHSICSIFCVGLHRVQCLL